MDLSSSSSERVRRSVLSSVAMQQLLALTAQTLPTNTITIYAPTQRRR
jgi:hypothetical protein